MAARGQKTMISKVRSLPESTSFTSIPKLGLPGDAAWKTHLLKSHERLSPTNFCPSQKNRSSRSSQRDCGYSIKRRPSNGSIECCSGLELETDGDWCCGGCVLAD